MITSKVIAIDGTAASGKGTIARMLAQHFGFNYLDSGKLYRMVAFGVLNAGGRSDSESDALKIIADIHPDPSDPIMMSDKRLISEVVAEAASRVAAIPAVRMELLELQRDFAKREPGAVLDGRDIGTVVCPDAPAKLFVDAAPEIRAHRRWLELIGYGQAPDESAILKELLERDERDRNRAAAPLKPAPDAALLDTSHLGIDAAFAAALALVKPRIEGLKARPRG